MTEQGPDIRRKLLVVVDETPECDRAIQYAAYRVLRGGGTVLLLSVINTQDFQHYIGVESVMRAEAREAAERMLDGRLARIAALGPVKVETAIREGRAAEQVEKLIGEDKGIGLLILASNTSAEGPGPLVTAFATRSTNALPVPVTIVPGNLSEEAVASVS